MVNKFFVFVLLICSYALFAQKDTVIYDEHNNIIAKGKIQNGKRIGEWEEYFKNTNHVKKFLNYQNDNRVYIKEFGQLYTDEGVKYYLLQEYCLYYDKYNIDHICNTKNTYYFSNGNIKGIDVPISKRKQKRVSYYENGKIEREELKKDYYKFDGRMLTRFVIIKKYYQNGNKKSIAHYKKAKNNDAENEKIHGIYLSYYENGQLKEQVRFKSGERIGISKTFYETGKIQSIGKYTKGHYTYSGDVKKMKLYKISFKGDTLETKNYDIEGIKWLREKFGEKSDFLPIYDYYKQGKWNYWDENGILIKQESWKKGLLVK